MASYTLTDQKNALLYSDAFYYSNGLSLLFDHHPHLASHIKYTLRPATFEDYYVPAALSETAAVFEYELTELFQKKITCNATTNNKPCTPDSPARYYYVGPGGDLGIECQPACFNLTDDINYNDEGDPTPQMCKLGFNNSAKAPYILNGSTSWMECPRARAEETYVPLLNDFAVGFTPDTGGVLSEEYRMDDYYCNEYFEDYNAADKNCSMPIWGYFADAVLGKTLIQTIIVSLRQATTGNQRTKPDLPAVPQLGSEHQYDFWKNDVDPTFVPPKSDDMQNELIRCSRGPKIKSANFRSKIVDRIRKRDLGVSEDIRRRAEGYINETDNLYAVPDRASEINTKRVEDWYDKNPRAKTGIGEQKSLKTDGKLFSDLDPCPQSLYHSTNLNNNPDSMPPSHYTHSDNQAWYNHDANANANTNADNNGNYNTRGNNNANNIDNDNSNDKERLDSSNGLSQVILEPRTELSQVPLDLQTEYEKKKTLDLRTCQKGTLTKQIKLQSAKATVKKAPRATSWEEVLEMLESMGIGLLEGILTDTSMQIIIFGSILTDVMLQQIKKLGNKLIDVFAKKMLAMAGKISAGIAKNVLGITIKSALGRAITSVMFKAASKLFLGLGKLLVGAASVIGWILIVGMIVNLILEFWDPMGFNNKFPPQYIESIATQSRVALRKDLNIPTDIIDMDFVLGMLLPEEVFQNLQYSRFAHVLEYFDSLVVNSEGSMIDKGDDILVNGDAGDIAIDQAITKRFRVTPQIYDEYNKKFNNRIKFNKLANTISISLLTLGGLLLLCKLFMVALLVILIALILIFIGGIFVFEDPIDISNVFTQEVAEKELIIESSKTFLDRMKYA